MTMQTGQIHIGDALDVLNTLPSEFVQCCVTSPPYFGLRDYGIDGQIGLEETPAAYIARLVGVFAEVHRVLKADGVLWLNIGDSYAGNNNGYSGDNRPSNAAGSFSSSNAGQSSMSQRKTTGGVFKNKDLMLIPHRVSIAFQEWGWYVRQDCVWAKPNPMPESVTDRPTRAHEYVFLLSKSERYFYDADAVKERSVKGAAGSAFTSGKTCVPHGRVGQGARADDTEQRNMRSVFHIPTQPYAGAHFACFPEELPRRCILAGSRPGDTILDPFAGSGTTLAVAVRHGRKAIGIELNPCYLPLIQKRIGAETGAFDMDALTADPAANTPDAPAQPAQESMPL